MPLLILFVLSLVGTATVTAEIRGILVEVTSMREVPPGALEYATARVNIYSDEKTERKRDASVAEAGEVLRVARDYGSPVDVEILFHHQFIRPADLITLLEALKDNGRLKLAQVQSADSDAGKAELERFKRLAPGSHE